jgi:hypothetical protein
VVPPCASDKGRAVKVKDLGKEKQAGRWEVGCWECAVAGRSSALRLSFVCGGQHCDDILIALGGLRLGGKLEVSFWEGCISSMQCNVKFGYQMSSCCRTEENHGQP